MIKLQSVSAINAISPIDAIIKPLPGYVAPAPIEIYPIEPPLAGIIAQPIEPIAYY